MKAGLDVTVRRNHSYYPYFWWGYPEGFGWDATIIPPQQDFQWRNLYDYPVRLFARVDRAAYTLRIEVWAPPELVPQETVIDGPYLIRDGKLIPTAQAGWVWWSSSTVIAQSIALDGTMVRRSFWSYYRQDPHRSSLLR
jgi:vancomycin resistance protein YoaR